MPAGFPVIHALIRSGLQPPPALLTASVLPPEMLVARAARGTALPCPYGRGLVNDLLIQLESAH